MTWSPTPDATTGLRPVRDSLEQCARRMGMPASSVLKTVFNRWADVVGPAVAAHAEPVSVTDGTLMVVVYEPGWATQLRFLGADVLRRLEEVAGGPVASRVEVHVRGGNRRS